jgi:hypothetical protein
LSLVFKFVKLVTNWRKNLEHEHLQTNFQKVRLNWPEQI